MPEKQDVLLKTLAPEQPSFRKRKLQESKRELKTNLIILLDQKRKRLCEKDLYYFTKYILGYDKLEPRPHSTLCRFLEDNKWKDTMLLAPRGTYKSTIGTVAFAIWMLVQDPNYRILISSADVTNSKGWLNEIRMHFESNDIFRELYGDWVPRLSKEKAKSWHTTAIRVTTCTRKTGTNSVVASGLKVSKVSQHYDMCIGDDWMNEKTVASRDQINKVEDHVQMITPILDPQPGSDTPGPIHERGTRWGHDDLYGRQIARDKMLEREGQKPKWAKFIKKYKNSKGRLYFPKVFTKAFLDRLEKSKTMTRYQITCQYFNDPQPDEDRIFKLDRVGFWNSSGRTLTQAEMDTFSKTIRTMPVPGEFWNMGTCDPAATETDTSDFTAIVVTGLDKRRFRYIQEVRRERWGQSSQIIQNLLELHFKFNVQWWGIEAMGFQSYLKVGFEEVFQKQRVRMRVEALSHGNRNKPTRIRGIEPFVSDCGMFFKVPDDIHINEMTVKDPRWGWNYDREALYLLCEEQMGQLLSELLDFPTATTRDCADALAYQTKKFVLNPQAIREDGKKGQYMSFEWWKNQGRKQRV
jgi:hypothetical protein